MCCQIRVCTHPYTHASSVLLAPNLDVASEIGRNRVLAYCVDSEQVVRGSPRAIARIALLGQLIGQLVSVGNGVGIDIERCGLVGIETDSRALIR